MDGGEKLPITPYYGGTEESGDPYYDESGFYVQGKGTGIYYVQFISNNNTSDVPYIVYVEKGESKRLYKTVNDDNAMRYYHYDTNKLYFTELAGFYYDNSIVIFLGNIN